MDSQQISTPPAPPEQLKQADDQSQSGSHSPILGFLNGLARWAFRLSLLGLAITTAGVLTFGSPDTTKAALKDSGAYDQAAATLTKRIGQEASNIAGSSLASSAIDSAAKASIPPAMIQRDAEKAIDTTFSWLKGDTEKLQLSIDPKPYINTFTGQIGDQALQNVASLPACTNEQLQRIDSQKIDVFNLPCRPSTIDLNTIKEQAVTQLSSSNELLNSSEPITVDNKSTTSTGRSAAAPALYALMMKLPWIFGILLVLCCIGMLAYGWADKRTTIKKIARSIFGAGVTLLIFVGIAKLVFWFTTRPNGVLHKAVADDLSVVLISFLRSLEQAFDGKLLVFAVTYTVLGLGVMLTIRFTNQSTQSNKKDPVTVK